MAKQILTVNCKLKASTSQALEIEATLKAYADACNWINVTVDPKTVGRIAIHHQTYYGARERFKLSANLTCTAIARVAGARKSAKAKKKTVKEFRPTSINFDERIFTFKEQDWTVGLTLLNGRFWFGLEIADYQRRLLTGQKPTSATLIKKRNGTYWIQIQVKVDAPEPRPTDGFLGVDLGIRRIAVTSDRQFFDGQTLQRTRNKFAKVRASLQRRKAHTKSRSTARLLKRLSGRERRYQTWVNHNISKKIVDHAKTTCQTIRMEDLKGIRERAKVRKAQRRTHHSWSFRQLRTFIAYKALVAGVALEFVNPAYTSKSCFVCHQIGHRDQLSFRCQNPNCSNHNVEIDADYHGSLNIAAGGAVVNRPEIQAIAPF